MSNLKSQSIRMNAVYCIRRLKRLFVKKINVILEISMFLVPLGCSLHTLVQPDSRREAKLTPGAADIVYPAVREKLHATARERSLLARKAWQQREGIRGDIGEPERHTGGLDARQWPSKRPRDGRG